VSADRFDLGEHLAALSRGPIVFDALLRGTPPAWHETNEGPETWSAREVVGHLVHAEETNWIIRARIILEEEGRPFEPFDRFAHLVRFRDRSMPDLLDLFAARREESLATLRAWKLTDEALSRRGAHPELGPVTLGQLISTWVVHDLGHLAQACRTLARHDAGAVGPWHRYLSILRGYPTTSA
jgi:hypothetical protein